MNQIMINGKSINIQGNNISVINGRVIVDGVTVEEGLSGIVEVRFIGDLANLKADGSVTVEGNVTGSVNAGGSVRCSDVGGDTKAGGSIRADKLSGKAVAGGSIHIG